MNIVHNSRTYIVEHPSECPHCHVPNEPRPVAQFPGVGPNKTDVCYTLWKCTYRDCRSFFVAVYNITTGFSNADFVRFLDGTTVPPQWPDTIIKMESRFAETYLQALEAEARGLYEICGMGFRKAIEYLVKDYLIQRNPGLVGKIEDAKLAAVIGQNFNDPREADLKDLLERATWLGNDMTHYLQYHINFDLNDLKELIRLVVDEIHSIEQKRHYIANIQSKYKNKDA